MCYRHPPDNPLVWLNRAQSGLKSARAIGLSHIPTIDR